MANRHFVVVGSGLMYDLRQRRATASAARGIDGLFRAVHRERGRRDYAAVVRCVSVFSSHRRQEGTSTSSLRSLRMRLVVSPLLQCGENALQAPAPLRDPVGDLWWDRCFHFAFHKSGGYE